MILLYDTELHMKNANSDQTGIQMFRNEINFLNVTQKRIFRRYSRFSLNSFH